MLGLVGAAVQTQDFLNEEFTAEDIAKSNNELTPKSDQSRRRVAGTE